MGNGLAGELKPYLADLHVHTVLSPCAEVEMIPPLIISEALSRHIELIAITDHNASANVEAVQRAAEGYPITVLAGMELQTREEVHVLCLFDTIAQLEAWQADVTASLPRLENKADFFGEQFIVDKTGDFIRRETQLLLTSSNFSFDQASLKVHDLGGLFIPAHVDRKGFGLFANLGFIPADVEIDAIEVSRHIQCEHAAETFPQIKRFTLVQDGDAHRLDELLGVNEFWLEAPTLGEIRLALHQNAGRKLKIVL